MLATFRCGHPRTPENTVAEQGRTRCIACKRARAREARIDDDDLRRIEYRQRYLPVALERTREKLRKLEREARELGLPELVSEPRSLTSGEILTNPAVVDQAWDREVMIAAIHSVLPR